MAGLLGDSWDDPKTQATLQLAAGLLSGGNFGQALGRGLQGYQQTMGDAQDSAYRKEMMDWKRQEIQDAKDQRSEKQRIQGVVRQALIGVTTPTQAISMDASGPTPQKAAMIGQLPALNANTLLAQGVPVETVKQLFEAQNFGKNKVARTVKEMGPDGKEYEFQLDDFGNKVGAGFAQYRAPIEMDTGGRKSLLDPYNFQEKYGVNKTMTPGEAASNQVAWANNAVSRGNLALSQKRLAFDQQGGAEANKPQYKDGQWVVPPSGMKPGESRAAMPGAAVKDANDAIALIAQAKKIIPNATGSYFGAGIDQAARVIGQSTVGDDAAAQLKALQGALVSKMPKMSGPQSDKDVQLYREMAGEIGDPTIPSSRKLAALQTIESIQNRYASGQGGMQNEVRSGGNVSMQAIPPAYQHKGKTIRDTQTGKMLKSDGMTWKEVQ